MLIISIQKSNWFSCAYPVSCNLAELRYYFHEGFFGRFFEIFYVDSHVTGKQGQFFSPNFLIYMFFINFSSFITGLNFQ